MNLPDSILEIIDQKEMVLLKGGSLPNIPPPNNADGVCYGVNNGSGRCGGVNNGSGICG